MNPTSLEYLYQVAPPVPDRAPTANRSDDDSSGFDNHLSQAASSVLDIVRSPSPPPSRSNYSPSTRSTTDSNTSTPSDSASPPKSNRPQKDQTANDSSAPANASAPRDTSRPKSRDDDKHDDKRDQDQSDAAPVAAVAGTAQPAAKESARDADSKDAAQGDSDQAKDKIAADVLSKTPTAETNSQTTASTKTTDEAQEITVGTKANAEVAKNNQSAATDVTDSAALASDQANAVSGKSSKSTARSDKAAAAAKAAVDSTKATKKEATSAESAGSSATAMAAATTASSSAAEAISAEDQSAAAKSDAKSDATAIGQTNHDHKDAASDNVQPAAAAAPAVADITSAVANITVPSPVNAVAEKPKPSDDTAVKTVLEKTDTSVGPLGRTLRTDLTSSGKTSGSDASPVDISRFVSRVAKAVQTASDRDGVVNLRLNPAELGSLKIQLTVKDGVMSAAVEADNSNARRMLLDHLPALRDRLADQNIRVDRFDVDVKQENSGGQASPRGFNQNPYQQQTQEDDSRHPATRVPQAANIGPAETVAAAPRVTSTGINLVI
ncbi:MAG TPA: flagellar hook-length control protein FliK [Lacipirellulaceae bacterium]|jgi:flagellar hook-length control protein FliK|nr:flagellar hook-length control protein FliK [Lacipirellulaceae bacterium]